MKPNNLVGFPGFSRKESNWDLSNLHKCGRIEHKYLIDLGHKKNVVLIEFDGSSPLKIEILNTNF